MTFISVAKADAIIAGVARRYGLSHAALNALAVIEGAAGPLPAGEITAQMHISTATMTSILDTLERRGYVGASRTRPTGAGS
jgi:DNA-binding MarR family transcriptional regulator